MSEGQQAPLNLPTTKEVNEYSDQTRQLRAFSHLVGTTKQDQEDNLAKQERLANTDLLTDLYNRRKIIDLLETEISRARRYSRDFSIIMFDIDNFKDVNDTMGHQAGDIVLTGIGRIIQDEARDTDLCARWGGEEFLVICPETNVQGASEVAERIRRATENSNLAKGLKLTVSGGVTEFSTEDGIDELLQRADKGLYDAKNKGKNQFTVWEWDNQEVLELTPNSITCPFCWETIEILTDPSVAAEEYIEDCQVCCNPITIIVSTDSSGHSQVQALNPEE